MSTDICVIVHYDDLEWKNWTTRYNCRFSAVSLALQVIFVRQKCPPIYASCMTISGGRTEQLHIIAGFLPRHWLYEWFSSTENVRWTLRILIDCSQLSKTYYNMYGSSIRDRPAWCIYRWTFLADKNHLQSQWCGRKPAIISSCSVLPLEIVMHDDAYVDGRSENNVQCIMHDDLGWKNQTTRYILPRHWLYEWFSQFHSCGTYSVLSQSHSIAD